MNERKVTNNNFAVVDGVYMKNHAIRKEALRHMWSAYHMLPEHVTVGLGKLEGLIKEIILPNKNEKDLFSYTHDGKSIFSLSINEKYLNFLNGSEIKPAPIKTISKGDYKSWRGKYENGIYPYTDLSDNRDDITKSGLYIDSLYEEKDESNQLKYIKEAENKQIFTSEKQYGIESGSTINDENGEFSRIKINNPYPNYDIFDEGDSKGSTNYAMDLGNNNYFDPTQNGSTIPNLKYKTIKLFNEHKIDTMVSRFQLSKGINGDYNSPEYIDSTIHENKGQSHGRSLPTKKGGEKEGGYKREYCRTWTNKYQYDSVDKLIRGTSGETNDYWNVYTYKNGNTNADLVKLNEKSVLSNNGFVRITPSSTVSSEITKCMFSIENLAWKDVLLNESLTPSQIGPNGGRVMWFPPYDLSFQENVSVNWNENKFIGRGESIYTYTNTMRSGTLGFTLLIDHPSILNRAAENTNLNTKEYEEDILRFFAGEQKLSAVTYTEKTTEKNTTQSSGTERITTGEYSERIIFNVYFPYKYSGNVILNGSRIKSYDGDIFEYLTEYYEVSNKKNIEKDKQQKGTCIRTDNSHYYEYRTDADLRVCFKDTSNYKYTTSDNLNDEFKNLYTAFKNTDDEIYDDLFGSNNVSVTITYDSGEDEYNGINMLRAIVVKKYIEDTFRSRGNNKVKINVEDEYSTEGEYSTNVEIDEDDNEIFPKYYESYDSEVNKKENKLKRGINVIIDFNKPEIIKLSTYAKKQTENRRPSIYSVVSSATTKDVENNIKDYYNEFDYFNDIAEKKNFAYESIKDKITYFNPAYHSMTPEGFNERLNFLHQCTRQGHTIEDNTNGFKTAGNLAFGRPPVCILRIGDFINTKILIESISIRYDNGNSVQWDLNHDGIGVQPMYAKVNMNIKIIGGQSLDGPVANLNNAVSFNYYANTGVYDKRALVSESNKKYIATWSVTPKGESEK
jgi:hypothetical protein